MNLRTDHLSRCPVTLETSVKRLERAPKDSIEYEIYRNAAAERWLAYRDNRNSTAHDYGAGFAEETLGLLPGFLKDARDLETIPRKKFGHAAS